MKHLFVINPTAGKKDSTAKISEEAKKAMEHICADYEIYVTKAPKDAVEYVRRAAKTGEKIRVYACGGDGTLNEAVNGAIGFDNVEITNYPCGTGNDFIKTFGEESKLFGSILALAEGESVPFDLIKVGDTYGINICSVGVDARIGGDVHKYSGIPLIKGKGAYIVSLVVNLVKGIGKEMHINIDGRDFPMNKYSLLCCCNGRYYGGGFNPVPEAMPNDGAFDYLVVKNISRFGFLKFVGKYSKGRYRELSDFVTYVKGHTMKLDAPEEFPINIDGEIIRSREAQFEMVPGALRFVLPRGCSFAKNKAEV